MSGEGAEGGKQGKGVKRERSEREEGWREKKKGVEGGMSNLEDLILWERGGGRKGTPDAVKNSSFVH